MGGEISSIQINKHLSFSKVWAQSCMVSCTMIVRSGQFQLSTSTPRL